MLEGTLLQTDQIVLKFGSWSLGFVWDLVVRGTVCDEQLKMGRVDRFLWP